MAQILGELVRRPGSNRIVGRIGGRVVVLIRSKVRADGSEVWQLIADVDETARERRELAAGSVDRH